METLRKGLRMPYGDFWIAYLDAHRHPRTRGMHYLATATGIAGTGLAIWLGVLWFMAGGIGIAVMMAVTSHWWIEHNRPLIRVNPFYGAVSDLRMCWLAMTGGLRAEYARLGLGLPLPQPARGEAVPANDPTAPFTHAA